jgi:hypothetical protein
LALFDALKDIGTYCFGTVEPHRLAHSPNFRFLTKGAKVDMKGSVNTSSGRAFSVRRLRLVGLLLFLTVFFLPLHFHPAAATAHVAKECTCIHGARTEMGMAPVVTDWMPPAQYFVEEFFQPRLSSRFVAAFQSIRAPPAV